VTQLAQFSSLEQNLAMRNDLDSINRKIVDPALTSNTDSSKTGTDSSSAV
jgi:flagellar hook assembly protein FlgD